MLQLQQVIADTAFYIDFLLLIRNIMNKIINVLKVFLKLNWWMNKVWMKDEWLDWRFAIHSLSQTIIWHTNIKMIFIDMKSETYSTSSQYYGFCLKKELPAQRGGLHDHFYVLNKL